MENVESAEAANISGEGVGGAAESSASESSTVSSAEPTSPETSSAEAVEAADSSQSSEEVAKEASEDTSSAFPLVEDFGWDEWDGQDYDLFPEQVRPWANKFAERNTSSLEELNTKYNTEVNYWKRMYDAVNYGEEDPRVAELTGQLEAFNKEKEDLQNKYAALEKVLNTEREAENERYFQWFEKNYQNKLETLAQQHGPESAEKLVLDLMDLDMDVHVAVEVALMGTEATDAAKELSAKVKDSDLVLEILKSRFNTDQVSKVQEPQVQKEEKAPNPATQVVAGSAPVSRPAQLAKEKDPVYGSGNARMASLMSAAENAIRKSKRR